LRELERTDYRNDNVSYNKVKALRGQIKNLLQYYKNFISDKQKGWQESAKEETDDLEQLKKVFPTSDYF